MLEELAIHNQFKESIDRYRDHDPHLKRLKDQPFVYHSPLLEEPKFHQPGIYLITGGRQIGKTTFLKQFILDLLIKRGQNPAGISFISGEIIDTHHILRRMVHQFYDAAIMPQYLFIDEVNYIPDWDKSIKFLADSAMLESMCVILTGSDSRVIRAAMKRLAGRRGEADQVDFKFFPLSFKEFVCLKERHAEPLCNEIAANPLTAELTDYAAHHNELTRCLYEYLLHGGYLPAINAFNLKKTIPQGVMNTYIHWIVGDILKYNKNEEYLFEILKGIKSTYNSQVSWGNLGRYVAIEHHRTIADYCNILANIHVLHIQEAIIEHKLTGAPKKNRKIYFCDPFIDHAVSNYLEPEQSIDRIQAQLQDNKFASSYVEAVAVDHCKRWAPTYYIKGNKGEVDIALVQGKRMVPIEVKWAPHIRLEDIKQIQQYRNGLILTPFAEKRLINNIPTVPLVRFLIHVSAHHLQI
jgi:predicted AAA+ superfamily ATPase